MKHKHVPDAVKRAKAIKADSWTLDDDRRCAVCDALLTKGTQVTRVPSMVFVDGGIAYYVQCDTHEVKR